MAPGHGVSPRDEYTEPESPRNQPLYESYVERLPETFQPFKPDHGQPFRGLLEDLAELTMWHAKKMPKEVLHMADNEVMMLLFKLKYCYFSAHIPTGLEPFASPRTRPSAWTPCPSSKTGKTKEAANETEQLFNTAGELHRPVSNVDSMLFFPNAVKGGENPTRHWIVFDGPVDALGIKSTAPCRTTTRSSAWSGARSSS